MRYLLGETLIASVFSLKPAQVHADCTIALTNCMTDKFEWCSYNGDTYWDMMIASDVETTDPGDTNSETGCNTTNSCYYIGVSFVSVLWSCTSPTVNGWADCGEYACVDDSDGLLWHSGDSEYCCSDNS